MIYAHRRQAAAAIDNSTWSRYAGLRHPVKPAPGARHYPQAGDNNLNRTRRPDYRGRTPIRPSHPKYIPIRPRTTRSWDPVRERALWLTYLPILPQCGHECWNISSVRGVVRASR